MKAIARTLNEQRRKTPALMQVELLSKRLPNTQDGILKNICGMQRWWPES